MKKWSRKPAIAVLVMMMAAGLVLSGCGGQDEESQADVTDGQETGAEDVETEGIGTGDAAKGTAWEQQFPLIAAETAADTVVDIAALQEENPDIFGWLYIPGTDIDFPVMQSEVADDYYESHNKFGMEDDEGALYIELATLDSMCDFNTVIHGKCNEDMTDGLFADLYLFTDPDFFENNEYAYVYIDGNLLTYEIFAAYERDDTSLIRTYDFTYISGCQQFLDDLYGTRQMGMNLRDGWDDVTPYHFLITLTTGRGEHPLRQLVVVAALVGDAAGTIDRVVLE